MRLKGAWHENKLIKGEWIFPNGTVYTGKFEYNKPVGDGIWKFSNGNVVEGFYK